MDYTTRLNLNKPDPDPVTGDDVDISKLNDNFDVIDGAIGFTICTSTARPDDPFQGQAILETDTARSYVWGGSDWIPLVIGAKAKIDTNVGIGTDPDSQSARRIRAGWGGTTGGVSLVRLEQGGTPVGSRALDIKSGSEANERYSLDFDGKMQWGPGSAGMDTTLYRSAADTLKTDDAFVVGTDLTVGDDATVAGDLSVTGNLSITGVVGVDDTVTITPPESNASKPLAFNHGHGIYVDNVNVFDSAGSRLWVDTPDDADVVIGPRAGGAAIANLRLRTDQTTASSANVFINSSTFTIARSTSSLRYKTQVEDLQIDPEVLFQLRPVRYCDKKEYAEQGENARRYVGLIAEEVDALGLSEFVHYTDEGEPDGVQYDRLTVALLLLVKQLFEERSGQ